MADESEEPEEGFNPVPEPALGEEDAMIRRGKLGRETHPSTREGNGRVEELAGR